MLPNNCKIALAGIWTPYRRLLPGYPGYSHVGRWCILHKTGSTTVLSHFRVQITFLRVPPEVETHTFWIVKTQVKAVWIALYDFGSVSRVDKSKSTLRPLFTTQAAINSWNFKLKIAENCRNTYEIHKGISINIILHCSVLRNPSSAFFFLQYWNRTVYTCPLLNGDHLVNLEELITCCDVSVCIYM